MDKGEKWVEGSVHNTRKIIWTNCNILWTYKFSSNILNNDEQDLIRFDQYWEGSKLHWWCYSRDRRRRRVWWSSRWGSKKIGGK